MNKSINNEHLVEKRNALNEIMWRDRLTLQALRFLSIYLSRINARDINTRKVRFDIKEFSRIMEFKGVWSKPHYISTMERLLGFVIHQDLDNGGIESFQLFKKGKLLKDDNGEWYVEMDAHDDALPLMFDFKDRYFTYKLWNVLRLKSFNALRMYEILKQYEEKGERTLTIEKLKNLLGIEPTEYTRWDNFKYRVIDSCQKALEGKTDIKFTYTPIRNGAGGKVKGIKFLIEKNTAFDKQITFDEFLGYVEDNAADIEPLRDERAEEIIIIETTPKKKAPKAVKNQDLKPFAEICEGSFTEKQVQELYNLLLDAVIAPSGTIEKRDELRKSYLKSAYTELLWREDGAKKGVCDEVKNRFSYLKGILKNKLNEKAEERK